MWRSRPLWVSGLTALFVAAAFALARARGVSAPGVLMLASVGPIGLFLTLGMALQDLDRCGRGDSHRRAAVLALVLAAATFALLLVLLQVLGAGTPWWIWRATQPD